MPGAADVEWAAGISGISVLSGAGQDVAAALLGDSYPPDSVDGDPANVLVPPPSSRSSLCVLEGGPPAAKVLPIYDENGWLKPGAEPPPPPPGPPPASALGGAGGAPSGHSAAAAALQPRAPQAPAAGATGAALARAGQLPTGVTGAALVRMGQMPAESQLDAIRTKKNPVCIKFLAGSCTNPMGCSQRHPDDAQEICHWLTYFKQRPCKAGASCIWRPNCVYGHPENGDIVMAMPQDHAAIGKPPSTALAMDSLFEGAQP